MSYANCEIKITKNKIKNRRIVEQRVFERHARGDVLAAAQRETLREIDGSYVVVVVCRLSLSSSSSLSTSPPAATTAASPPTSHKIRARERRTHATQRNARSIGVDVRARSRVCVCVCVTIYPDFKRKQKKTKEKFNGCFAKMYDYLKWSSYNNDNIR